MQKTGPLAIQTWMAQNEARLFDAGLLYVRPRTGLPARGAWAAALNRDPPKVRRLIAEVPHRM